MFSVTTPDHIRANPANTSTSKARWSFSKASRFKDPRPYCKSSSYEKHSSLSNRKAGIGYGHRSAYFEGNKQAVEPGRYQTISDFHLKDHNKKGYSFTANRDNLNFSNYLKVGQKTPSPVNYKQQTTFNKKARAYSMREKLNYPKNYFLLSEKQEEVKKRAPGPGRYETIDQLGSKYFSSKCANGGKTSFIGKQRFINEKRAPGPGDYESKGFPPNGNYILSNMKGSGRVAIVSQKRQLKLEGNKYTPGPGSYRLPSEFGHYQFKPRSHSARK